MLYSIGRFYEAETQLKIALESDFEDPHVHYNYGVFLEGTDRLDEAEKEYKLASEMRPKNLDFNYKFVRMPDEFIHASDKTDRLKNIKPIYKKSSEKAPTDASAYIHYRHGILLYERGQIGEAEQEYKLALAGEPRNLAINSNYAIVLDKMGRQKEAEEHYKVALEIDPQNSINHNNYGYLLDRMGKFDKAEEHYKAALEIDPQNLTTRANYSSLL